MPNVAVLTGDAMGVFKVWQFLNSWGIINYQAGAGADDDAEGVPLKVQPAGTDHPSPAHLPFSGLPDLCALARAEVQCRGASQPHTA